MGAEFQEGDSMPTDEELQEVAHKIMSRTHYVGYTVVIVTMVAFVVLRWSFLVWVPLIALGVTMLSIFLARPLAATWLGYKSGRAAR